MSKEGPACCSKKNGHESPFERARWVFFHRRNRDWERKRRAPRTEYPRVLGCRAHWGVLISRVQQGTRVVSEWRAIKNTTTPKAAAMTRPTPGSSLLPRTSPLTTQSIVPATASSSASVVIRMRVRASRVELPHGTDASTSSAADVRALRCESLLHGGRSHGCGRRSFDEMKVRT